MNHMGNNAKQMMAIGPPHNGRSQPNGNSNPLPLEERLKNSILPRKSFEVHDLNDEMPITCIPEVIEMANNYLEHYGIDTGKVNDTTKWDIFWAREMAAAKMVIGFSGIDYQHFLPGRYFMYDLLTDSIATLLSSNNNVKGKRIAEFGGGSGIGLVLLAQQGAFVANLDTSRMALEFSRYLAQHHGVAHMIDLIPGSFYEAPFDPGRFDVVYNAGVFEHLDDDQANKLLYQMARATKPGGYVVVSIPNENSPFYKRLQEEERSVYDKFKKVFARLPWEERRRTFDFRKLMEDAGLDFIKEDGLLVPPSEEVKRGYIQKEDILVFKKYLSPVPYQSVEAIITNWRGLHGSVSSDFRIKYGWSTYFVGQKKAA